MPLGCLWMLAEGRTTSYTFPCAHSHIGKVMDKSRLVAEAKATWRVNALFKAMSTDYLLREQFATDPAQVLSSYVHGTYLTQAATDTTNQLLFAVLSCTPLRCWMGAVAGRFDPARLSRHSFAVEFANAVAASNDDLVTLALIRCASDKEVEFMARLDLLRWITGAMGAEMKTAAAEMCPDDSEMNPPSGRKMSHDALRNVDLLRGSIRNVERLSEALLQLVSDGTATSSEGETAMIPASRPLADSLVTETRLAASLSDQLVRAQFGLEMSPGAVPVAEQLCGSLSRVERLSAVLQRWGSDGAELIPEDIGMSSAYRIDNSLDFTEAIPDAHHLANILVAEVRLASQLSEQLGQAESGPEMTLGGTEMSPGGTERSPGGTEMSPGATERSPGGTEMSPGGGTVRRPGFRVASYSDQALDALARYGANLRSSGALSVSGLEDA